MPFALLCPSLPFFALVSLLSLLQPQDLNSKPLSIFSLLIFALQYIQQALKTLNHEPCTMNHEP